MALTLKQQKFVDFYLGRANGNATRAAQLAGYAGEYTTLKQVGAENLAKPYIAEEIQKGYKSRCMGADEVLQRLADQARGPGEFLDAKGERVAVQAEELMANGMGHLIKGVKVDKDGNQTIEFYDSQAALVHIGKFHKLFIDRQEITGKDGGPIEMSTPEDKLAAIQEALTKQGLPPLKIVQGGKTGTDG